MQIAKRVLLFIGVNILVVLTLSVVASLLGIPRYMTASGLNFGALIGFCLLWGFGGALISLAISRIMAKFAMGVKVIDPNTHDPQLRELVNTVHRLARSSQLPKMPEVGVYDSPEVNAFATGPTKSRSLVAVSSGLLHSMDKRSVEGVLAHEVAHIANGDMVTMTLLQGVVNAFAMFLARIIAFAVDSFLRDRDEGGQGLGGFAHMMVVWVMEFVFMLLGSIVVMWFSRWREFRADAGGARLAGRESMVAALRSLHTITSRGLQPDLGDNAVAALKISGRPKGGLTRLFMSHPPLEERIARLEQARSF
ncbi:MAG: protease HtpX [Bdellovibrionaceae bacterium]|nr:protease HtpX [Pseudobdellovibrionaceae bacterium]